jgi:hypothetical protein
VTTIRAWFVEGTRRQATTPLRIQLNGHLQVARPKAFERFPKKVQTYLKPAVPGPGRGRLPSPIRTDANMVFQLIWRPYERAAIILTSNREFPNGARFSATTSSRRILDRLLHHCLVAGGDRRQRFRRGVRLCSVLAREGAWFGVLWVRR